MECRAFLTACGKDGEGGDRSEGEGDSKPDRSASVPLKISADLINYRCTPTCDEMRSRRKTRRDILAYGRGAGGGPPSIIEMGMPPPVLGGLGIGLGLGAGSSRPDGKALGWPRFTGGGRGAGGLSVSRLPLAAVDGGRRIARASRARPTPSFAGTVCIRSTQHVFHDQSQYQASPCEPTSHRGK